MKAITKSLCVIMALLLLCSCTHKDTPQNYTLIDKINHYVVDPDDAYHMSEDDTAHYTALMDAMLTHKPYVKLSNDDEKNLYYIDLLKQSPYFFFLSDCHISGDTAVLDYAYSSNVQDEMLDFMDSAMLSIVNKYAQPDDNDLDKLLKVYFAVTNSITYDHSRDDNKTVSSPLLKYPADEVYKALKNGTSLCHGFAYIFKFAMLQHGIDCFTVYGQFTKNREAHMWNVFKLNGKFYTCDASWDRADDAYSKLYHFGKTDDERKSDSLISPDFSDDHFADYGDVKCTDKSFEVFRGINRFSYISEHDYYMESYDGDEYIYNTDTMKLK